MNPKSMGVVGAGIMGSGIAQVAAQSGLEVVVVDADEKRAKSAVDQIGLALGRLVAKEKISQADRDAAVSRLKVGKGLDDLAVLEFVVEAATERLDVKVDLFAKLDRILAPDVTLASNTSSISITRLGAATKRPDKVIGMHFMNPVPVMKLVEVVRGLATSDATVDEVVGLARRFGKTTVSTKDLPGFLVNRVLMPMINEGIYALMEGLGSPEEIDTAMRLGTNQPMGPLALADLIGLDTCLSIMEVLHTTFGDPKYRPCPILRHYVDAGWHGKKSGRGFYTYQ
ncbi:MAG: 3-hydroxybutyryl-CoA dehydrogenase [Deltaproteobacteria bacterium]|nr:3-hydroxybutyryl-CoA dehydrogenase [Deltaproteobacteria bacterium]